MIDSPGIFKPKSAIEKIQEKIIIYLKNVLIIFVIDGKEPLTTEDYDVVRRIRKSGKK